MAEVVRMPKMSDTMTEGVIAKWHKKVGDKVNSGDVVAEVETDKATMDFESYQEGTLLYTGPKEGEAVPVDAIIAVLGEEGEDFEALLKENNELAMFFIRQLSKDLGVADERTVNLTQKHIRGRLAESLLFLKDSYGLEEDQYTLSIYLSREDLANLSNMTTSNAIRTLSNFAAEKLIAIDGRKIKILEEEKLKKISKIG